MVLCEKTGKKIVEVCSRVFLNGLKELARRQNRMRTGVPETDRSAGNGGKSVVFRKNIGNYRKIRGGIDMMCSVFS